MPNSQIVGCLGYQKQSISKWPECISNRACVCVCARVYVCVCACTCVDVWIAFGIKIVHTHSSQTSTVVHLNCVPELNNKPIEPTS